MYLPFSMAMTVWRETSRWVARPYWGPVSLGVQLAGIAVAAVALAIEPVQVLLDIPLDGSLDGTAVGIMFFDFILTLLGVVGGAVGGAIEGVALRRRLGDQDGA